MFDAMERGELTALYVIGENPAQSDADAHSRRRELLEGLDHLVVQEIFLTKTAQLAHVVLPGGGDVGRGRGHRHQQRAPRAARAQGGRIRRATRATRSGSWPSSRKRLGRDWGDPTAEEVVGRAALARARCTRGMSYERLEELGGIAVAVSRRVASRHAVPPRAAVGQDPAKRGRSRRSRVRHERPVEQPDDEYPFVLTTGRRLESYNTGVQTGGYLSPLHRGETLDISPEDAERARRRGRRHRARVTSRRGTVEAPVRIDRALRAGVVFMTLHFPDDVATNLLTINATDPRSGTAEFKACAVRVEPLPSSRSARGSPSRSLRGDD